MKGDVKNHSPLSYFVGHPVTSIIIPRACKLDKSL